MVHFPTAGGITGKAPQGQDTPMSTRQNAKTRENVLLDTSFALW
jgi:hypothetical protein